MPLYSYACEVCQHEEDVLQKMADAPLLECPSCLSKNYFKVPTLPNGKVRACQSAQELGLKLPSEEAVAKRQEAKEAKLPWWRSGKVEGLPKKLNPIKLNEVKDVAKYVETGEKS